MGFHVFCDNKGCRKDKEPLLDVESDKVFCTECGNSINSITRFAKVQMKTLGQIKRNTGHQESFAVECTSCNKAARPIIDDDKLKCSFCNTEFKNLSKSYIQAFASFYKESK